MHSSRLRMHSSDQAERLRSMVARRAPQAKSIAVASGKGGVGKSNIAVNLSICLAARGLRVTLVDVDLGLANADLLMNIQVHDSLSHVVSGARRIEDVSIDGPGGIRFVPGASGLSELADLSEFDRQNLVLQLQKLEDNADIVILDCGAGISRNVLAFALAADRIIVVTTPQATALTDAYATIKSLHRERCCGSLGLFVNMARSRSEAQASFERISSVSEKFLNYSVADHGYMLHDTVVESAVRERCPFVVRYPESNAAACIAAVARQVSETLGGKEERGGFFKRVVGLFV